MKIFLPRLTLSHLFGQFLLYLCSVKLFRATFIYIGDPPKLYGVLSKVL